jgi:hypothetical protein
MVFGLHLRLQERLFEDYEVMDKAVAMIHVKRPLIRRESITEKRNAPVGRHRSATTTGLQQ